MADDRAPATPRPGPDHPSEATTHTRDPSDTEVSSIGPYRLLQKIGEGGMGEVWLAEQTTPIRRNVAIKIIKAGMDTRAVVARFEAERQALSMMNHPAIAKVYDAGETRRGLPYFTMEHVKGEPITTYCDRHRLTNRERLTLFTEVCAGVQHAHQKGIIHRDLKPSNVLMTLLDGRPTPKIIDFGVAKATAHRLTERTIYTELGLLIGTPEYMSPEQAEMTSLDIDTRTDVYSLGIMLYELIVGALPFERAELRRAGYDEIRRQIRELDPPRPSTRISSLGAKAVTAAHNRRTEPGRLVSLLRGDLDWITMKALEKDRTRRYGSPQEMAADIVRHLSDQPVVAGPPSALYRAMKFGRRHRAGVVSVTIGLIALMGFAATMAVQSRRIARENIRARRVSDFLVGLFSVSNPSEARGNSVTAREILDKGAEQIHRELATEPELEGQLALTMGKVYASLGLYGQAEPLLRRSIELQQRVLGPEAPDSLEALDSLAFMFLRKGQDADAEKLYRQVVDGRTRRLGLENRDTLNSMHGLAVALEHESRFEESATIKRQVYEIRLRLLGEDHPETLQSMNDLASVYLHGQSLAEAEALFRKALEGRQRLQGADHPDTLWVMNNLGIVLLEQHRLPEAEKVLLQTLDLRRRVMGEEHRDTLATMSNLANLYSEQGRNKEAEEILVEILGVARRVLGEDSRMTHDLRFNLAAVKMDEGKYAEAERVYLDEIEAGRRRGGERDPFVVGGTYNLACLAMRRGQRDHALAYLRSAVDHGFNDPDSMTKDPDLEPLRADPMFESLVVAARKNGAPSSK